MPKRWYDNEPTTSLALSMLKNASIDMQNSVCELLDTKFSEMNIKKNDKFVVFKVFDKRWYDEKENLYNVIETIRCCNEEDRRKLSICIIDHLCNLV